MRYGSVVHKRIERVCALLKEYSLSLRNFYSLLKRVRAKSPQCKSWFTARFDHVGEGGYEKLRRYVRDTLCPATQAVIRELVQRKWEVVGSEVACACPTLGIATAADLVVRDTRSGYCFVIELKTGYQSRYFMHANRYLSRPWHKQRASPYALHQLQLAYTQAMMRSTYPAARWKDGVVLRVNAAHGVRVFPLKAWAKVIRRLPAARRRASTR
jgi:hypothetical protein